MPPRFRLCPLCQQGFGSASLDIHIPQCYQKALKRWQVNPVGPMPIMPGSKPPLSRGGKHGNSGVPCNRSAFVKQSSHDGKSSQNIPEYIEENANLHPCSRCGRKFLFDRIAYHESVCKANMKLKVFDSRKQRAIEGQSDDVFRGTDTRRRKKDASSGSKATVPSPGIPRTRWREQHREFIEAMRAARGAHKASAAMWGDASVKEVQLKPSRLKCTPPAVTRHMKGIQISRQRAVHSTEAGSVKEQRPARELPRQARNSAFGGGGERFNYRTSNGGGQMRIINDNTTSLGMLQAFGRA